MIWAACGYVKQAAISALRCAISAVKQGRFDRIVSVGMLEHVGRAHLPTFFRKVSQCLEDDGIALIHTIGRIGTPGPTDPFITK